MANALYLKALEAFANAQINWIGDAIKAVLVDTNAYTPDFSVHQFLSDVPVPARTNVSPALSGKTNINGVLDADDQTFFAVSGPQSEAIILFKDTGLDATSRLLCYIDTAGGLPVTPGGGDIFVVWDNAANKLFRI